MLANARLVVILVVLFSTLGAAQTTTRISLGPGGQQANSYCGIPVITPDGRFVAYESTAYNLIANDSDFGTDVFVWDRATGVTTKESRSTAGADGNIASNMPAITPDGRYVAFQSLATNLVAGDTNGKWDVFLRDRQLSTTVRLSLGPLGVQADNDGTYVSIAADGRTVAFQSAATNLVAGDTNAVQDVFVADVPSGTVVRASVDSSGNQANGESRYPAISANGRYVFFESSASNLVTGDANGQADVFVRDLQGGTTILVSVSSGGVQGDNWSHLTYFTARSPLSADGRYVAFESGASNLVPGDTNGTNDVFVRDIQGGTTTRVSVATGGAEALGGSSRIPAISPDGRFVVFTSGATNLTPEDTTPGDGIFLHDRQTGTTESISLTTAGVVENIGSNSAAVSADGRYVAFSSVSNNLVAGDTNSQEDIFLRDRGGAPVGTPGCPGDGSGGACPCANSGGTGRGCASSQNAAGALLGASGTTSPDTVVLVSTGELPAVLTIFLQGDLPIAPVPFGDGLRCAGGNLKRLSARSAYGGATAFPTGADSSITAQSATLGDPISSGSTRVYQAYYRDADPVFCAFPTGNTWNATNAVTIGW